MRCPVLPALVVLLASACSAAGAAGLPDFRVVLWYRRDRPLAPFIYPFYDLRKGQYTPAVNAWVHLMRTKYTAYQVVLRDVNLEDEKGETEILKVGAVVKRELMAAAALEGVVIGYGVPGFHLPTITPTNSLSVPARINQPAAPGATVDRSSYLNPPGGTSFPFPMPYPRPHP